MEKKIIVYGREVEYDGKKFWSYKAEQKNGKLMSCKYTREINIAPPKESVFIMVLECDSGKNNVSNATRFPVLWVSEVLRYEEYNSKRATLDDYFE